MPSIQNKLAKKTKHDASHEDGYFGIGDLAVEFGVTHRTIRFYEQRGLITPIRDRQNRYFSKEDRERLAAILEGRKLGLTLGEIKDLLISTDKGGEINFSRLLDQDSLNQQIQHLEQRLAEINASLAELYYEKRLREESASARRRA